MPSLPVICDTCGAVFGLGAIALGPEATAKISNVSVGPCPKCGGTGTIPDGVYTALGDVLSVVLSESYPPDTIETIVEILGSAVRDGRTATEIADELAVSAPALSETLRALLIPKTPEAVAGYLSLILTLIVLIRPTTTTAPTPQMTQAQIEKTVATAVAQVLAQNEPVPPPGVMLPKRPKPAGLTHRPGHKGRKPKKPKRHR